MASVAVTMEELAAEMAAMEVLLTALNSQAVAAVLADILLLAGKVEIGALLVQQVLAAVVAEAVVFIPVPFLAVVGVVA